MFRQFNQVPQIRQAEYQPLSHGKKKTKNKTQPKKKKKPKLKQTQTQKTTSKKTSFQFIFLRRICSACLFSFKK